MKIAGKCLMAVIMIMMLSCGPGKDELNADIQKLEKEVFAPNSFVPDKQKATELIALYEKYAEKFPKDSVSGLYLYKGGKMAMSVNDGEKAISLFDKVTRLFPGVSVAPECVFLTAFVYENNLRNITKARDTYKDFLQKYPSHDLADDARLSLDNLGKTPEQIVKEFEEKLKAKEDSLAAAQK